ncbi:MAG: PepSY domain-containing protein [Candidatus Hermodarchaeota archaeon]
MNQNKNDKRFLKCFLAGMVILIFIAASLIAFNTSCLADNDSNPYCSGDSEKIQELTEDFIQKYGEGVEIRWDEDTGFLEKISRLDLSGPGEPEDRAFSFLSENASFLGIDINDIEFSSINHSGSSSKINFDQYYKGIPVYRGKIWVTMSKSDKAASSVHFRKFYYCLDIDTSISIIKEQAEEIVKKDLGVGELFYLVEEPFSQYESIGENDVVVIIPPVPLPNYIRPSQNIIKKAPSITLLIFPYENDTYLCWEIIVKLWDRKPWYYYIDAHTGEIVSKMSGIVDEIPTPKTNNFSYPSQMIANSSWLPTPSLQPIFSSFNSILNSGIYGNSFPGSISNYGQYYNNSFIPQISSYSIPESFLSLGSRYINPINYLNYANERGYIPYFQNSTYSPMTTSFYTLPYASNAPFFSIPWTFTSFR